MERDDVLLLHHKLADLHSLRLIGGVTVQFRTVTLQVNVPIANADISAVVVDALVDDFLFLQIIQFLMFIYGDHLYVPHLRSYPLPQSGQLQWLRLLCARLCKTCIHRRASESSGTNRNSQRTAMSSPV